MNERLKINVAAFFMVCLWASAYVGIRIGLKGYSPGAMALFRYAIASICMFFIYARSRRFRRIALKDLIPCAILGVLGFSIYNITLNYGEISVNAGIASFIVCQIPVIVTILAVVFFRQPINWVGILGTVVSFLGILLIAMGEAESLHVEIGVVFVLIATLSGSLYSLFQKNLLQRLHPIEFTSYAIWFGTLAMMGYLPALIREIPQAPIPITLAVVYNGIFPAAIAYLLWSVILSKLSTIKAASMLYFVPVVSTLMGLFLLHEIPTVLSLLGSIVALSGAVLVNRSKASKLPISVEQTDS